MIGRQVGNYQVLTQVGEDGLGFLYGGRHIGGGTEACLRHFVAQLSEVPVVQRYFGLAQRASQIGHPGIARALEHFWSGRNAFVVTEPIGGESLATVLRRDRRLWPELCVKLGWQIASAMAAAHSHSVVHGMLRPESLFVWPDADMPGGYKVKIIDFGASTYLGAGSPDFRDPKIETLGFPLYMAPEQGRMGLCDYRTDVYSLGCILFHLSTGRAPYLGQSAGDILQGHVNGAVRSSREIEMQIPPELDALCRAMMNKDPGQRPMMPQVMLELARIAEFHWPTQQAAAEVAQSTVQIDLKVGKPPPPVNRKGRGGLIAAIIAASLVVIGGVVLLVLHPWKTGDSAAAAPVAAAPPVAAEPADAAPAAVAKVEPADAAPAAAPTPPTPVSHPAGLSEKDKRLAEANKALKEERWADAQTAAKAVQKIDPKDTDAEAILKITRFEPPNKLLYDDFVKTAAGDDVAKAVQKYKKIPKDSVYAAKAQTAYDKLRDDYLHVKGAEATALADTKKCAKIAPISKEVAMIFPEATAIKDIEKSCK